MEFKQSLYETVRVTAEAYPENNAMLFMGKYMNYREFHDRIEKIAGGLYDLGVRQGDTVTMAMPNIFEAVIAFYATIRLGAIGHMVHPLTPVMQMDKFMKETKSNLLIILDSFYGHYKPLIKKHKNIKFILASPVSMFGFVKFHKRGVKIMTND